MKDAIIRRVLRAGEFVPESFWRGVWKTMLQNQHLISSQGWRFLSDMADKMHVDCFGVSGDYGRLHGSPRDAFILREYALKKTWASSTNNRILKFFADGEGTFLDIGANIGMTLIPIASRTRVICHAFEPDPTNYRNLELNVKSNCHDANVTLHQLALFDRISTLSFELSDRNLGDHRIRSENAPRGLFGEDERQTIQVEAQPLDELAICITHPFFAKIDTQGAEPFVFKGGRSTLSQADIILFEWSPYQMKRMQADVDDAIDFIGATFTSGAVLEDGNTEFVDIGDLCLQLNASLNTFSATQYADVIVSK